jgi:hypothetical protein
MKYIHALARWREWRWSSKGEVGALVVRWQTTKLLCCATDSIIILHQPVCFTLLSLAFNKGVTVIICYSCLQQSLQWHVLQCKSRCFTKGWRSLIKWRIIQLRNRLTRLDTSDFAPLMSDFTVMKKMEIWEQIHKFSKTCNNRKVRRQSTFCEVESNLLAWYKTKQASGIPTDVNSMYENPRL